MLFRSGSTLNVSGDWLDPDGDPVYLKAVAFPSGFDVTYRADGTITVRDLGQGAGVTDLTVTYSDGTEDTEGILRVDVRGSENVAPTREELDVPQDQPAPCDGDWPAVKQGAERDPPLLDSPDSSKNIGRMRILPIRPMPEWWALLRSGVHLIRSV